MSDDVKETFAATAGAAAGPARAGGRARTRGCPPAGGGRPHDSARGGFLDDVAGFDAGFFGIT
ncbi:hypothetical protein, partial [Streptomyces bottropensis]|uniref:hypothetical protein n=1 Tax=Streptomyces bottropensis TaxID=42235 RepID=UPI003673C713